MSFFFLFQSRKDEKPKAEINLDDINVVFTPDKIGNPNGMQITYFSKGSTRNLFVYTDDPKVTEKKKFSLLTTFSFLELHVLEYSYCLVGGWGGGGC